MSSSTRPHPTLRHCIIIGGVTVAWPGEPLELVPVSLLDRAEDRFAENGTDEDARLLAAFQESRRRALGG
jgi:hypothetical protein